jgi:hypothetical protein
MIKRMHRPPAVDWSLPAGQRRSHRKLTIFKQVTTLQEMSTYDRINSFAEDQLTKFGWERYFQSLDLSITLVNSC